jgi:hypothetical protein
MFGRMLKQLLLDQLDLSEVDHSYAAERELWEMLDKAACIFVRELMNLHAEATITTVASQQAYDLPGGFLGLYMKNYRRKYFLKYYDGSNYSWPIADTREKIYKQNYTTAQTWPNRFAIVDKETVGTLISGTATAAGAAANGQCTLTDATKLFTTTNRVWPRDIVYNVTDVSMGYVLEVTDATNLLIALFDGTDNDVSLGDAYKIQPSAKSQIFLDAPSESTGHIISIPYVTLPEPVFSDLGSWRFSPETCKAIVSGAAALMKTPKREYKEAMQLGGEFAQELGRASCRERV